MIKEATEKLLLLFREKVEENTLMSQGDITEIKTLPAIVVRGPRAVEVKRLRTQAVMTDKDVDNGTYTKEKTPRWYNLRFDISVTSENFRGLADRMEALSRIAQSDPLLRVEQEGTGRVREYLWDWSEFPSNAGAPNFSGVYEASGELVIWDVETYSGIQTEGPLITSVEIETFTEKENNDPESDGVDTIGNGSE